MPAVRGIVTPASFACRSVRRLALAACSLGLLLGVQACAKPAATGASHTGGATGSGGSPSTGGNDGSGGGGGSSRGGSSGSGGTTASGGSTANGGSSESGGSNAGVGGGGGAGSGGKGSGGAGESPHPAVEAPFPRMRQSMPQPILRRRRSMCFHRPIKGEINSISQGASLASRPRRAVATVRRARTPARARSKAHR